MNNLLLTSDKVDLNEFRKKYPTNILNLSKKDIFQRSTNEESHDIQSYNLHPNFAD